MKLPKIQWDVDPKSNLANRGKLFIAQQLMKMAKSKGNSDDDLPMISD